MRFVLLAVIGLVSVCGNTGIATAKSRFTQDPYPSTYRSIASGPVLIEHATVLTGTAR